MASGKEILTIGHSNHEEADFIELLRGAGVELLADVRANPRSRYPQFNRSDLAGSLKEAGIEYVHLGEQLGGRREHLSGSPNTALPEGAFRGYADHMASEDFIQGLERLRELATTRSTATGTAAGSTAGQTAVMCAEADWTRCHRRLIADALAASGWRVLHLGPDGSLERHRLTESAVVEGSRITYPRVQTSLDV